MPTRKATTIFNAFETGTARERLVQAIARQLGAPPEKIAKAPGLLSDFGMDSLDQGELVMQLESELEES